MCIKIKIKAARSRMITMKASTFEKNHTILKGSQIGMVMILRNVFMLAELPCCGLE